MKEKLDPVLRGDFFAGEVGSDADRYAPEDFEDVDYDNPLWEERTQNRAYLQEVVRQTCQRAMQYTVAGWSDDDYAAMCDYITHKIAAMYGVPNFFIPPRSSEDRGAG